MKESNKNCLVYGLCRRSDQTIRYIGMTSKGIQRRFYEHQNTASKPNARPVYKWMQKYDDVIYVILADGLTTEEAFERERQEIASRTNLLNCTIGGEGLVGATLETRQRMSASKKGKPLPQSTQEAARLANIGRRPSAAHIAKLREINTGAKRSLATRAKISAKALGRIPHNKGQNASDEARAKMSISQRNRTKVICPICDKSVDPGNARRWHFDNCKVT
jgi:hypothetical protein